MKENKNEEKKCLKDKVARVLSICSISLFVAGVGLFLSGLGISGDAGKNTEIAGVFASFAGTAVGMGAEIIKLSEEEKNNNFVFQEEMQTEPKKKTECVSDKDEKIL